MGRFHLGGQHDFHVIGGCNGRDRAGALLPRNGFGKFVSVFHGQVRSFVCALRQNFPYPDKSLSLPGVVISKNIIFVSVLVCRISTVHGVVFLKTDFTPQSAYFMARIWMADR
jgi:hypothetical protein